MFNPLPYALDRHCVLVSLPNGEEVNILPLWHEAERAPGIPHDRPDAWRVLIRDHYAWRSEVIFSADATVVDVDPNVMPPRIHVDARPGSFARAETLAVFIRYGVRIRFGYDKGEGVVQSRHGTPLGFKSGKDGHLLVLADADRDGATRSFKLAAVSGILALGPIPSWKPMVGWMMPPATTVDPDADAAGVTTAAKVDEMTDRRKS